jgi:hypothetical protein
VERLGINFGAPGDRIADDGTPWLNYPNAGDSSMNLAPKVTAERAEWFRLASTEVEGDLGWVAGSGVKGIKTVSIPLVTGDGGDTSKTYTVNLHFAEPDTIAAGERVFDVLIDGERVLEDFDIVGTAGEARTAIVKQVRGVKAGPQMTVTFVSKRGEPLICGIEILAE